MEPVRRSEMRGEGLVANCSIQHFDHRGHIGRFEKAGANGLGGCLHRRKGRVDVQGQRVAHVPRHNGPQGIVVRVACINNTHQPEEIAKRAVAKNTSVALQHLNRCTAGADVHVASADLYAATRVETGQFHPFAGTGNCIFDQRA